MRLYVDLTCTFEEIGRIAHGTLRVERGLVGAFAMMNHAHVSFVRYDRVRGQFLSVDRDTALAIVTAPTVPESRRGLRADWRGHVAFEVGRKLEKWVRHRLRDPLRRLRNRLIATRPFVAAGVDEPAAPAGEVRTDAVLIFARDSILLLTSELRHRQSDIVAVRRAGVRLAFVFYDLLKVLPPGDPRRTDPNDTDLPFTDFMAREADFVLSISRFSANELARYVAERNVTLPDVSVIRLSGGLGHDAPRVAVAGLSPRRFVICVGDITPRKNQALLIDVWRNLAERNFEHLLPLVLVGRIDKPSAEMIRTVQNDARLARHIKIVPNLADGEVAWLYENCRFSVFPSLNEGFGLPVAESLGLGRVCIASTAAAIPEAGQGASIGLDPHDIAAWEATIARLLADDVELDRFEDRVKHEFRPVTWTDTAHDVLSALSETNR